MTTTLTPTTIGDQIVALPPDLANSIAQARTRFDAAKKASAEDDDDADADDDGDNDASSDSKDHDSNMSFADKMKAAKAAKSAKKDSDDVEAIFARIDALEAENAVLASLVKQEEPHEDAPGDMEGGDDEGDDEDMTPQQIALQMIDEFTEAKPFLPADADITKYQDIYDIYQDAIAHCYPDALVRPDLAQEDDDDRINPMDADELRGAFLMMVIASHGMKMAPGVRMSPGMSMDSAESNDRSFATALGLRIDGCDDSTMPKEPKRTEYY
jgi:hypothetical protein